MTQRESELIKVTQQVSESVTARSQVPAFLSRTSTSLPDRVSQCGLPGERSRNEAPPLSWMNSLSLVSDTRSAVKDDEVSLPCASVVLGEWGNCKEPTMRQQSLWRLTLVSLDRRKFMQSGC